MDWTCCFFSQSRCGSKHHLICPVRAWIGVPAFSDNGNADWSWCFFSQSGHGSELQLTGQSGCILKQLFQPIRTRIEGAAFSVNQDVVEGPAFLANQDVDWHSGFSSQSGHRLRVQLCQPIRMWIEAPAFSARHNVDWSSNQDGLDAYSSNQDADWRCCFLQPIRMWISTPAYLANQDADWNCWT